MRFDEDNFDLTDVRRKKDAEIREKANREKVKRQVRIGKIAVFIATVVIFFILFYVASQMGLMNFR